MANFKVIAKDPQGLNIILSTEGRLTEVSGFEDFKFFISKTYNPQEIKEWSKYSLSELTTGMRISMGDLHKECIKNAEAILNKNGKEKLKQTMENNIRIVTMQTPEIKFPLNVYEAAMKEKPKSKEKKPQFDLFSE